MSPTVAVIGAGKTGQKPSQDWNDRLTALGPAGVAAIKALRDEGFEVTAFERRSDVGGLWTFDLNPEFTSATQRTIFSLSQNGDMYTDKRFQQARAPRLANMW